MIKEEIIGNLIKDVAFAEYLIKSNLSEYDMAKLVCHAPISLCEKGEYPRNRKGIYRYKQALKIFGKIAKTVEIKNRIWYNIKNESIFRFKK